MRYDSGIWLTAYSEYCALEKRVQSFGGENDAIIWQFNSTGKYSVQYLYAVINDRCVKHVYTPMM
jgi:hypothetical protein